MASVSVSFVAPTNTGGLPILSYTVTSTPGNITSTSTGSPIVITGLIAGTTYTFAVHATNANGDGPESASSNAVTPIDVPGSPTNIVAIIPGVVVDPYYSNVVLLLHADGTNGSNQFIDSSSFSGTLTTSGTTSHTTVNKKFGSSSVEVNNNTSKIQVVKDATVDLTGTYTIEFWARTSNVVVSDANAVLSTNDNVYPNRFVIDFYSPTSTSILGRVVTPSNMVVHPSPTQPYVLGDWAHFAFVNDSAADTFSIFINGVSPGSRAAVPLFNTTTFQVGKSSADWAEGPYQIDDLRITKDIARYTSTFTPPTAPFPDA